MTKRLAALGFSRTKTTVWVRQRSLVLEYLHLHLFSHSLAFRVHAGLRIRDETFDAAVLCGPASSDGDPALQFSDAPGSIDACIAGIEGFVLGVVEPWFMEWRDLRLLASDHSPLTEEGRHSVRRVLQGKLDMATSEETNRWLGVA